MKRVSTPVRAPVAATQRSTAAVISTSPRPGVGTSIWCCHWRMGVPRSSQYRAAGGAGAGRSPPAPSERGGQARALVDRALGVELARLERAADQVHGDAGGGERRLQFAQRFLPRAQHDRVER